MYPFGRDGENLKNPKQAFTSNSDLLALVLQIHY